VHLKHKKLNYAKITLIRVSLAQWVEHLTHNRSALSLNPIKGSRCFQEQDTLTLLVPRVDSSMICVGKIACVTMKLK